MTTEKKEEEFNPFGSINLMDLQELGDLIPDDVTQEVTEETEHVEQQLEKPVEQEEEVTEEIKEQPSSKNITSSLFTPIAKLLQEEGIAPNIKLEEFDGTPEGILKAIQNEISIGIEAYKETNLDPRVKWLQDNLEQGVPLEDLLAIDKQAVQLDKITEEVLSNDANVQKDIVRQYYKETTRFTEDFIEKAISRLEATDDLLEESKTMLGGLKEINVQKQRQMAEQAQEQARQAKVKQEETLKTFKATLDKTDEIVTGVKLNTLMREKIYKTMTTPVDIDQTTGMPLNKIAKARMEDPIGFEIKLAYLYEATNGFKDWAVFGSAGKKKAFEEFENAAKQFEATQIAGGKNKLYHPQADEDLAEIIRKQFGGA